MDTMQIDSKLAEPLAAVLKRYPADIAGAALFAIDREEGLLLTDTTDQKLEKKYLGSRDAADAAAKDIRATIEEFYAECTTGQLYDIVYAAFETAFGKHFDDWQCEMKGLTRAEAHS